MKIDFKYLSKLLVLSGALFLAFYIGITTIGNIPVERFFYAMFIYFPVITFIVHYTLSLIFHTKYDYFVPSIMAGIGLKMLLSMGLIVVYILQKGPNTTPYTLMFVGLYFIYTLFEVLLLIRMINDKKKS